MAAKQQSPTKLPPNTMTTEDVAARVNLGVSSVRVMMARARTNREQGRARETDMPPADFVVFRSPLWKSETIEKWARVREEHNLLGTPKPTKAKKSTSAAKSPGGRRSAASK